MIGLIRALIVSGDPGCRQLVRAAFGQEPLLESQVSECEDIACARAQMQHHEFDLVIVGTSVEDIKLIASDSGPAIVFLAQGDNSPAMNDAVIAGATDYISPSDFGESPALLWVVLRQTIRYHSIKRQRLHLVDVLRKRNTQVLHLTQRLWRTLPYDFRTGFFTHRQIVDRLAEEMHRASRYQVPLTMALVQFDGWEELLTDRGQEFSDSVVTEMSHRMRVVARQSDLAGHYGNNAILFLLPNTALKGAHQFCQRMQAALQSPIDVDNEAIPLKYFYGVAELSGKGKETVSEFLQLVETRIEHTRQMGRTGPTN